MLRLKTDAIIIAGYLGSGKTTLINRALTETPGLRSLVLVNDFGEINIDANLIAQSTQDIISLVNGCACCQIGDDLTQTLETIVDQLEGFDRVILEASGVADLANLRSHFEGLADHFQLQELMVVDGSRLNVLVIDKFVGLHVRKQVSCARNILLSKLELIDSDQITQLMRTLNTLNSEATLVDSLCALVEPLEKIVTGPLSRADFRLDSGAEEHLNFFSCVIAGDGPLDTRALEEWLACLPDSVHRVKGYVETEAGWVLLQYVTGRFEMIKLVTRSVPIAYRNKLSVVSALEKLPEGKLGSPWL